MKKILELTNNLDIPENYVIPFGHDKAKIDMKYYQEIENRPTGKVVLVTAITPTKAGEGKTTTTIGLHDGLSRIGVNSIACLREPSLGPVWGIKGGAVGALKSTIIPSDDINLHFTGDFHALTSTINLIAALIENHIYQGNKLNIDPDKIVWSRALDINDRSLRSIKLNVEGAPEGVSKECVDREPEGTYAKKQALRLYRHGSEFVITVASELMTILTISQSEQEFMDRVNNIIVAYTYENRPVYFGEFNCSKAILKMMKNAMNPNLVQTLEENPVLVHCGPFANISIGVNSINATKLAMKLAPVVVTEAGFGADLGAEKFLDIKCQLADIAPSIIVLVATVRALKLHGGVKFENLDQENIEAMSAGMCNLQQHAENMKKYGVPVVITANRFPSDTDREIAFLRNWCKHNGYEFALNEGAIKGSEGAIELAEKVNYFLGQETSQNFKPLYSIEKNKSLPIKDKIEKICTEIYRAAGVEYSEFALKQIEEYTEMGYGNLPVCISKTPNSFTDDALILGAPRDFKIRIREVKLYAGAGLIVPLSGSLLLMPGLPKEPRCLDKFN